MSATWQYVSCLLNETKHALQVQQLAFGRFCLGKTWPVRQLENCPRFRIEIRPTTLGGLEVGIGVKVGLDVEFGVRVWRLTLTFNPRRATVMTHTHTKAKGHSVEKLERKWMDGWMDVIALPPMLMESVTTEHSSSSSWLLG